MAKQVGYDVVRAARPAQGWSESEEGRRVWRRLSATTEEESPVNHVLSGAGRRISRRTLMVGSATAGTAAVAGVGWWLLDDGPVPLDAHDEATVEFYRQFSMGGAAMEQYNYGTVEQAVEDATVVILGIAVDVHHYRTVVGEVPTDRVHSVGVVVEPLEVLRGKLPSAKQNPLTVEFLAGAGKIDMSDMVARMRSRLPEAKAVWILRSGEETVRRTHRIGAEEKIPGDIAKSHKLDLQDYSLVNSKALLVQGKEHVISATAIEGAPGLPADAERFETMSKLMKAIRNG